MMRTRAAGQPSATASSCKAYWRAVDSRLSNTCWREDWRTETTASFAPCRARIFACPRPTTRAAWRRGASGGWPGVDRGGTEVSAVFMRHLLRTPRERELLGHETTEGLEGLATGLGG